MPAKSGIYFTIIGLFQFISMAFLIICCVTAPVFKQIGLSKYESITYGVFGYCSDSDGCSKASSNYSPYNLTQDDSSWKLNSNARKTLGSILIIMPIAAGLNFGSFLSSIISAIFAIINNNGTQMSAFQFIIDLIFQILAFCSAALMCIITFLLFYPHITWCSWLLIPAAVLPLISIPLLIMAYMSNGSKSSDDYIDNDEMNMTGNQRLLNVEDLYQENPNNNNITSLDHNNVILPDIEKKTDSFTFTSRSDSDDSTNSDKQDYNIYENENPSHSADNVVDNDEQNSKLQQRFSVIDSDTDDQNNKMHRYIPSDSLGSSVYSEKDHYSEIQPKNQDTNNSIMQDFMNHANHQGTIPERDEEGSVITSVSRNGPNRLAAPPSMPYPASNASVNNNNNMNRQRNFPQQQNMPMNMNYIPQQQYYMPPPQQQMPTASEMIMQNNTNFLPNGSNRMNPRMQRPQNQNFANRNMMIMNQQNTALGGGNTHFAPAYKRRINNRANVYQNINGTNNGFGPSAYNFR